MATRPRLFRSRAVAPQAQAVASLSDERRGKTAARGYGSRWRREAAQHLAAYPLCAYCEAGVFGPARVTPATLVDHLYPHRGDQRVFWLRGLWASACVPCHSGPKQAIEQRGLAAVPDLDRLARRLGRSTLTEALMG